MSNTPNSIALPPPVAAKGPAWAEITVGYPQGAALTISSHENGVRLVMSEPGADDDAEPILHERIVPWEGWYKIRSNIAQHREKSS